jgi:hypothetical protein
MLTMLMKSSTKFAASIFKINEMLVNYVTKFFLQLYDDEDFSSHSAKDGEWNLAPIGFKYSNTRIFYLLLCRVRGKNWLAYVIGNVEDREGFQAKIGVLDKDGKVFMELTLPVNPYSKLKKYELHDMRALQITHSDLDKKLSVHKEEGKREVGFNIHIWNEDEEMNSRAAAEIEPQIPRMEAEIKVSEELMNKKDEIKFDKDVFNEMVLPWARATRKRPLPNSEVENPAQKRSLEISCRDANMTELKEQIVEKLTNAATIAFKTQLTEAIENSITSSKSQLLKKKEMTSGSAHNVPNETQLTIPEPPIEHQIVQSNDHSSSNTSTNQEHLSGRSSVLDDGAPSSSTSTGKKRGRSRNIVRASLQQHRRRCQKEFFL